MNFVPEPLPFGLYSLAVLFLGLFLTVGTMMLKTPLRGLSREELRRRERELEWTAGAALLFSVVGLLALIVSGIFSLFAESRDATILQGVEDSYGLELSAEELEALEYPQAKPSSDFKVFGSVDTLIPVEDGAFERRNLFLLWQDGELILAKPSGQAESYIPLESVG